MIQSTLSFANTQQNNKGMNEKLKTNNNSTVQKPQTHLSSLLRLGLVGNLEDLSTNSGLITKVSASQRSNGVGVRNDLSVLIKVIDERNGGRDVETSDSLLGNVIEVHDKGSETVAVSSNDDALASLDLRIDDLIPVGEETVSSGLEGLGVGDLVLGEVGVSSVVTGVVLGVVVHGWGRNIIGTAPDHDLQRIRISMDSNELVALSSNN